jgi:hypothetical protein
MKYVFGTMIAVGFVMVLGAAGNDCDGKCMENAAPIGELLKMVGYGIALAAAGTFGLLKTN